MAGSHNRLIAVLLAAVALLSACAPSPIGPATSQPGPADQATQRPSRTLVFIARTESDDLASLGGVVTNPTRRFFHSALVMFDDRGAPQPRLAQALPELNTDTWQVFPDGQMETTYRLKPGLVWHDGAPLTAADFILAWRVGISPGLEKASPNSPPFSQISEVVASDESTLRIRWKNLFPDAGAVSESLPPLPRHLLESLFEQAEPVIFDNHPYWTAEFVGVGPYRVAGRQPGVSIEGSAFERYVMGRPKIDRVRIIAVSDPNTVVANLLAGEAHLVAEGTLRVQAGTLLQREWSAQRAGTVYFTPAQVRYAQVQMRPDLASPSALLDVRTRRAIAHATDRQALIDGLFDGQGTIANALIPLGTDYADAVERATTRYPYDPRRVEQLLGEAGFAKGADGYFASPALGRFELEWRATSGGDSDVQLAIVVDGLKRAGFDARSYLFPQAQDSDNQARASFPALSNTSTTGPVDRWFRGQTTQQIPSAANRWSGTNRGGWSNSEYDRIERSFTTTLDRAQRSQLIVDMMRVLTEDVGVIPLYYNLYVAAHAVALRAPRLVSPDATVGWNLHEWEME